MPVRTEDPVPYAPAHAILGLIDRYRNRGLATPITTDVLQRAGVSDSLVRRTLIALETLDLTDEAGMPTPELEGLARAPEADFQTRLAEVIREAYAEVFSFVDPAQDDLDRVRDAFRAYEPRGMQSRMVSLFLGLCEAAGIIEAAKPKKSRKKSAKASAPSSRAPAKNTTEAKPAAKGSDRRRGDTDGASDGWSSDFPPALVGLLQSIPKGGWTRAERARFLAAFGPVLDVCVPVREEKPAEQVTLPLFDAEA